MYINADICVYIDIVKQSAKGIWMELYHKTNDTQRYLSFTSSHPNHCQRNISYSFQRSICTIG